MVMKEKKNTNADENNDIKMLVWMLTQNYKFNGISIKKALFFLSRQQSIKRQLQSIFDIFFLSLVRSFVRSLSLSRLRNMLSVLLENVFKIHPTLTFN